MRTPAENYFGPEGFTELLDALTKFGQERLGCTAISPPWLSVYVDGCEQRYHTDSWHGPWAFVLSLTGGGSALSRVFDPTDQREVWGGGRCSSQALQVAVVYFGLLPIWS